MLKSVQENRVSRLDLAGYSRLQAARSSTHAKHARSWSVMLAGALQDKIGQLTVLLSRGWISRLSQAASPSREPPLFWKTWRFTFFSHPSINTPYTHKRTRASRENFEREFWERNPRVKQDWFIYNLYIRVSSNSSTLFLSIVKPLRGILPKPFLTISITVRGVFWCFRKQLGRNQFTLVDDMIK